MRISALIVAACFLLAGCPEDESGPDPDSGVIGDGGRGSDGGSGHDGGTPIDDERPLTISPFECQADVERLVDEDFEVREHPLPYKGQLFVTRQVPTPDGDKLAVVSLLDDRPLLTHGQALPGVDPEAFSFVYGIGNRPFTAPDHGDQNDPDYPVAFIGQIVANFDRRNILLRIDPQGALRIELTSGDTLGFGGEVESFSDVRMGSGDDIFFLLKFKDDAREFLARQASPGAPITKILATGDTLRSIDAEDPRLVAAFHPPLSTTLLGSVMVRVSVADSNGNVEGFAHLSIDTFFGDQQCVATDSSIDCGGIQVSNGRELEEFDSDGVTTGGVVVGGPSVEELHYKVVAMPRVEEFKLNEEVQGFTFRNFKTVRACPTNNSLYFVSTFFAQGRGNYDELMRIDEDGMLSQITDFGSLREVAALEGETPDEIRNFALGYNCDAVMYTWGPSRSDSNNGYEGYWAAYAGGDVIEVIDETAARADNGNDDLTGVSRARSGIDPNTDRDAMVTIAPNGDFYFIPRLTPDPPGPLISSYFRASEPVNRCRTPAEVNSTGDDSDMAPGDGECNTGGMVGSDPECTLRAAIEETNAAPGSDAIESVLPPGSVVMPSRPLPPITSRLTVEGAGLILDSAGLSGDAVGLDVQIAEVEIRNFTIRNGPSHGIRAAQPITLDGIEVTNNCGWGIWLEAKSRISGTSRTSSIAYNGIGDGCEGGGIYSSTPLVAGAGLFLSQLASSHNGGPGIMAQGKVQVSQTVTASNNDGAGVHLEDDDAGFLQTRLTQPFGTLITRNNRDHGVTVVDGGLSFSWGNILADGNCRFGVSVEDGAALLGGDRARSPRYAHSFRGNGRTQVGAEGGVSWSIGDDGLPAGTPFAACGGGGIGVWGTGPEDANGPSRVLTATIAENQGPGIATTDVFRISDAWISGNIGPGVVFFDASEETSLETDVIRFIQGPSSRVDFNSGPGVAIDVGSLDVSSRLSVRQNVGSGIEIGEGHISLNRSVGEGITDLRQNGDAARMCQPWEANENGWVKLDPVACPHHDGAVTGDGDISATGPIVRDNAGAGFRAADPEEDDHGTVQVEFGQICGNGEADVAVTFNYTMVDTTCE